MAYDVRASILYDLNQNPLEVQDGVVIPVGTSGILTYGTDAGTARIVLVDAGGRPIVVGAAADGTPPVGNPLLIAGQDGINVQSILTDATGRLLVAQPTASALNAQVQGTAADGVAPVGNPVLIAGSDGVNVQTLLTDATGKPLIDLEGWFGSVAPTVGQKTSANSIPVVLPSDQTINVNVASDFSITGTTTSVAASLVTVTLLAANAARKGATIFIDGGAANDVYVKMGAAASTVSFTNQLSNRDYYEVPFGYTGIITAIWSPVAAGNARITEFT